MRNSNTIINCKYGQTTLKKFYDGKDDDEDRRWVHNILTILLLKPIKVDDCHRQEDPQMILRIKERVQYEFELKIVAIIEKLMIITMDTRKEMVPKEEK